MAKLTQFWGKIVIKSPAALCTLVRPFLAKLTRFLRTNCYKKALWALARPQKNHFWPVCTWISSNFAGKQALMPSCWPNAVMHLHSLLNKFLITNHTITVHHSKSRFNWNICCCFDWCTKIALLILFGEKGFQLLFGWNVTFVKDMYLIFMMNIRLKIPLLTSEM